MTSQARIDSNRRNAKKSTGPKTAAGKARSRFNGLKHGLRSEEVVLPTEDPAAFREHLDAFMEQWKPTTIERHQLVERLAVNSWRLRRCVRVETQRLSTRMKEALADWDRRERDEIVRILRQMPTDPHAAVSALESTRAGASCLVDLWHGLIDAASRPGGWNDPVAHHSRYFLLLGILPDDPAMAQYADDSWRLLLANNPELALEDELTSPFPPDLAESARLELLEALLQDGARLEELRDELPDRSAERSNDAEIKAFAFLPEDIALMRHEGRLDRAFRADVAQLIALSKLDADLIEAPAPTEPNDPNPVSAPTEAKRADARGVPLVACPPVHAEASVPTGGQATSATQFHPDRPDGSPSEPYNCDDTPLAPTEPNGADTPLAPTEPNDPATSNAPTEAKRADAPHAPTEPNRVYEAFIPIESSWPSGTPTPHQREVRVALVACPPVHAEASDLTGGQATSTTQFCPDRPDGSPSEPYNCDDTPHAPTEPNGTDHLSAPTEANAPKEVDQSGLPDQPGSSRRISEASSRPCMPHFR